MFSTGRPRPCPKPLLPTSAEADLASAAASFSRLKPLLEIKAVSQQEYDQASARHKQAEAALARARLDLENAVPPAPISGRIGRALVTEGALVGNWPTPCSPATCATLPGMPGAPQQHPGSKLVYHLHF